MKTKNMMTDQLQKWLNKHVEFIGSDNKTNKLMKKAIHKSVKEKLTNSVGPQAATELVERTNHKSNKKT